MQSLDVFSLSWALAFGTVMLAAFVRGVSGFGGALILAPVMLLIFSSKSVVAMNLSLGLLGHILVLAYSYRRVHLKGIIPMAAGSLLGIPLGFWVINVISPATLKVLVGGVTIAFAVPLALGFSRSFSREKAAGGTAGFASGFLWSSTSLGGPPVVMFMHYQRWSKEVIHASLAAYFLFSSGCALALLAAAGFMNRQEAVFTVSLVPAFLIGLVAGMLAFRRINQGLFRWLALAIIIAAGLLGIASGTGLFP